MNKDSISSSIVISKADRKLDISSHLVKLGSALTVENTGKTSIKSFLYAIDPTLQSYLSFIGASVSLQNSCSVVHVYRIQLPATGPVFRPGAPTFVLYIIFSRDHLCEYAVKI